MTDHPCPDCGHGMEVQAVCERCGRREAAGTVEDLMRQLPATPTLYLRTDGSWSVRWGSRYKNDDKKTEGATAIDALRQAVQRASRTEGTP